MQAISTAALQYRQGLPADKDILRRICYDSYAEFEQVLASEHWEVMRDNLTNETAFTNLLARSTSFVCTHSGQIVAAAYLLPSGNPTAIFPAHWSYIRMLGVLPGYRGLGIGRELTKHCIEHARASGEETLALHTSEFQQTARNLYESLGFVQLRQIEPIHGRKYWIYTLSLQCIQPL